MRQIDISTTQKVTITYELAPLRERVLAHLADAAILMLVILTLNSLLLWLFGFSIWYSWLTAAFFTTPAYLLYHFLQESLADGRSLGKRLMGLKVVRLDGREAGMGESALRALFLFVDVLFSSGVLGALLISSSNKSQRLGDMAANTALIRLRGGQQFLLADILRLNELGQGELRYPQVRHCSEQDMLLAKNLLARQARYPNAAHAEALAELVAHFEQRLGLPSPVPPGQQQRFLRELIRDYIILTR